MSQEVPDCYDRCNSRYTPMQPQRLFCKKGCDSDESSIGACRIQTCNKICIKEQQGDQKLIFKFLYRAPRDSGPCLDACVSGCNMKDLQSEE